MAAARRPIVQLVRLRGAAIYQQLLAEELLLRGDERNWCIINDGTATPSIVMGIAGRPAELLDAPAVAAAGVPVIRRFSGGGTVFVDGGTVFATLICGAAALPPGVPLFPRALMAWTERLYAPMFRHVAAEAPFALREHDYVLGDRKFGGNAQSITKDRFLHHTSFLWDFDPARMAYLKLPRKTPAYREGREHDQFICRLKDYLPSRADFVGAGFAAALEKQFYVKDSSITLDSDLHDRLIRRLKRPPQTKFLGKAELLESALEGANH